MKPDASSYVFRRADQELFDAVLAAKFCYILTARQMGKSSLMARTALLLAEAGVRSAQVDLTLIGADKNSLTPEQWYYGVSYRIAAELDIPVRLDSWWRARGLLPAVQRFTEFLRDVILTNCPSRIVIFVDEIDSTIGLPFADDFFAGIRAVYNARAAFPPFERLSFVLLGVATPAQLISDPKRTPFNIGHGIELTDFELHEASPLAKALDNDNERSSALLQRVLYWTGGHPYLTQALCRTVTEKRGQNEFLAPEKIVDQLVADTFLAGETAKDEKNLKFVRERLTQSGDNLREVLRIYRTVVRGEEVKDIPASTVHAALRLSGVVKPDELGILRIRNRIYAQVFNDDWARRESPPVVNHNGCLASFAGFCVVSLIVFFWQSNYYNDAHHFQTELQAERIVNLRQAWIRYQQLASRRHVPILLWGAQLALKDRLVSAADQTIFEYRNNDAPAIFENQWKAAHEDLVRAAELDPGDNTVKGRMRLCEGHLDRIDGTRAARLDPTGVAGQKKLISAVAKFQEAADLLKNWPDPYLGLARIYAYDLGDLDRAEEATKKAAEYGHPIGKREQAQLADGYHRRADRTWRDSRAFTEHSDQERDYLEKARQDYLRAQSLYAQVGELGSGTRNLIQVNGQLKRVEQRIAQLQGIKSK